MKKPLLAIISVGVAISGCSTASKDIAPAYVSPMQYLSYDCQQIMAENQRLSHRASQLGGRLDEAAANDKALGAVGLVLFWPALFALGGTKTQEAEYARLRGEHDALEQASIQRKCGVQAETTPSSPTRPATTTTPAITVEQGATALPSDVTH